MSNAPSKSDTPPPRSDGALDPARAEPGTDTREDDRKSVKSNVNGEPPVLLIVSTDVPVASGDSSTAIPSDIGGSKAATGSGSGPVPDSTPRTCRLSNRLLPDELVAPSSVARTKRTA